MTNFKELFEDLKKEDPTQCGVLLLNEISPLRIYYGFSSSGFYRLAFISSVQAPDFPETKAIKVSRIQEGDETFWTCFDLHEPAAAMVFFTFCTDLVDMVCSITEMSQHKILLMLKNRYIAWRSLFQQEHKKLSEEQAIGLFGELYFLKKFILSYFDESSAINGWSGVDGTAKDFSIDEKWYEVKTISLNSNTVKINSLAQLSSNKPGVLTIVRYEKMSESYNDSECTIYQLLRSIISMISDQEIRTKFLMKLVAFGCDIMDEGIGPRLKVSDMSHYRVEDGFPRIQEGDVKFNEIDKVIYTLIVNTLEKFKFNGEL